MVAFTRWRLRLKSRKRHCGSPMAAPILHPVKLPTSMGAVHSNKACHEESSNEAHLRTLRSVMSLPVNSLAIGEPKNAFWRRESFSLCCLKLGLDGWRATHSSNFVRRSRISWVEEHEPVVEKEPRSPSRALAPWRRSLSQRRAADRRLSLRRALGGRFSPALFDFPHRTLWHRGTRRFRNPSPSPLFSFFP